MKSREQRALSREQASRVREAREISSDGALREPVENKALRSQGFDFATMGTWCPNPPSSRRFAPRTLRVLGILAAAALSVAGGCLNSTETNPTPSKTVVDEKKMNVTKEAYGNLPDGTPDGTPIDQYTLSNPNGLKVKIINYGAITTAIETPDRNGHVENITLYRDSLADYLETKDGKATTPGFGATIGRYGNRIAKGRFTLEGKPYTLAVNNGPNALHGGLKGFDKVIWKAEPFKTPDTAGVVFSHTSPDGWEGYPGTLQVKVTYSLTDKDELKMDYEATTDKPTVLNLTNHDYWNLAGAGNGDILKHELMINADRYLPVDDTLIPLGRIEPVKGTAMDFTSPKPVGRDIAEVKGGYDHCYVLNRRGDGLSLAARVSEPTSGRVMEIYTTQPAIQFYTGNPRALCLETQHYPDSPNQPSYPSTLLRPGQKYTQVTVHKFSVLGP